MNQPLDCRTFYCIMGYQLQGNNEMALVQFTVETTYPMAWQLFNVWIPEVHNNFNDGKDDNDDEW